MRSGGLYRDFFSLASAFALAIYDMFRSHQKRREDNAFQYIYLDSFLYRAFCLAGQEGAQGMTR